MNALQLEKLEEKIGYVFTDKDLLTLALTHSSYANEIKKRSHANNERLEFLGDAVLDMIVSEYMFVHFPEMPEGELTKLRAAIVCESSLAVLARKFDLGHFLRLGKGEETTGGRGRDSILADAFEAVIGAVCLDGGMEAVRVYILGFMVKQIEHTKSTFKNLDCKTHLQEVIQKISKVPLQYKIVDEQGPDHNKMFVSVVEHDGKVLGRGTGKSKKEAEQSAANNALEQMNG
ncbi:ribonuclease III [Chakrabartyella piscis]|uniref:ribonuclease III n=1 Tax=Chakrabartyella piscis TaxID=2918914 RepID=UPI002958D268|nr:ribonuclease III [Chakrabartyella piscis]